MQRQRIILIILGFISIILLGVGVWKGTHRQPNTGNLTINLQVPDTNNMTAKLNDQKVTLTAGVANNRSLAVGNYTLTIAKVGYKNFTARFAITKGQTTQVTAALLRVAPVPTQAITPGNKIPDVPAVQQDFSITDNQYFYDKTWDFATATLPDGTIAYIVMRYNDSTQAWETVITPSTIFTPEDVNTLPADLANYIQQNGYVLYDVGN